MFNQQFNFFDMRSDRGDLTVNEFINMNDLTITEDNVVGGWSDSSFDEEGSKFVVRLIVDRDDTVYQDSEEPAPYRGSVNFTYRLLVDAVKGNGDHITLGLNEINPYRYDGLANHYNAYLKHFSRVFDGKLVKALESIFANKLN